MAPRASCSVHALEVKEQAINGFARIWHRPQSFAAGREGFGASIAENGGRQQVNNNTTRARRSLLAFFFPSSVSSTALFTLSVCCRLRSTQELIDSSPCDLIDWLCVSLHHLCAPLSRDLTISGICLANIAAKYLFFLAV